MKRLAALAVLAVSCVSLTPGGEKVRATTNPDVVRGCKYLGPVATHGSGWAGAGGADGLASENTEKTIRNRTAAMGGNVVFLITSGALATGDAYRCENAPAEAAR